MLDMVLNFPRTTRETMNVSEFNSRIVPLFLSPKAYEEAYTSHVDHTMPKGTLTSHFNTSDKNEDSMQDRSRRQALDGSASSITSSSKFSIWPDHKGQASKSLTTCCA
jgi:hypothetical protein